MAVQFGGVYLESDEQLYIRVRGGDRIALAGLVERYHGPLLKFLTRMIGQTQCAEDLVQDAFIRLLTYRGVPPEHIRPWIYQIARNLARDYFRSAAFRRETFYLPDEDQGDDWMAAPVETESLALQSSDCVQVNALLQCLPARQREVILLRWPQA